MHGISDKDLIQAALDGNRRAYGRLVERYQSAVCAIAYGTTGDASLSEDVGQETFVAAWKGLAGLRDFSKFRPWLLGIARNVSLLALRKRRRDTTARAAALDEAKAQTTNAATPLQEAISHEEARLLWQSIERIPEAYRIPLVLYYREGCSVQYVAEMLGISSNAAKQRLFRGRQMVREEVAKFVEGALEKTRPRRSLAPGVLAALSGARLIPLVRSLSGVRASLSAAFKGAVIPGFGVAAGVVLMALTAMLVVPKPPEAKSASALARADGTSDRREAPIAPEAAASATTDPDPPSKLLDERPLSTESTSKATTSEEDPRQARIDLARAALREAWLTKPMEAADSLVIKGWTYLAMLGEPEGKKRLMEVVRSLDSQAQLANWHMLVYLNDHDANDYLAAIAGDPRQPLDIRVKAFEGILGEEFAPAQQLRVPEVIEAYYRDKIVESDFALMPMRRLAGAATESSRPFLEDIVEVWAFDGNSPGRAAFGHAYAARARLGKAYKEMTNPVCVVEEAISVLKRLNNPDSVPLLREVALDSPSSELRCHAICALCAMGEEAFAVEQMMSHVRNEHDILVQMDYAYHLAEAGNDSYLYVIRNAMAHRDANVRTRAYAGLCELGDSTFIEAAAADFRASTGEPVGYYDILAANGHQRGFRLQGRPGYLSTVLRDYLYTLTRQCRTPQAEHLGLSALLSGSDKQLRLVLPLAEKVLREPPVTWPAAGLPDKNTSCAHSAQVMKLVVMVRAGDDGLQDLAVARVQAMYEHDSAARGSLMFLARWARSPKMAPLFARIIEKTPNANERVMAAAWLLANEAGVLPE